MQTCYWNSTIFARNVIIIERVCMSHLTWMHTLCPTQADRKETIVPFSVSLQACSTLCRISAQPERAFRRQLSPRKQVNASRRGHDHPCSKQIVSDNMRDFMIAAVQEN